MGAVIESWPNNINTEISKKPMFSTFVLNVTSDDGGILNEKVYGSTLTFYEEIENSKLIHKLNNLLSLNNAELSQSSRSLFSNKAIIILSRNPLFTTFKEYLLFIFNTYSKLTNHNSNDFIPIERYLYFLIHEVPFPTPQKPRVLVNLTDKETDCLSINLPFECQLPQS